MRARIAILTVAAYLAFCAQSSANDFCFYKDSSPAVSEMSWQAIRCWQETHWWVNGYSGIRLLRVINSTAREYRETGYNLHADALVDWDPATGGVFPSPAGYWVTVN